MQKSSAPIATEAPFSEAARERMATRIKFIIENTTGVSPRGCAAWRKSKIAARLIRRIEARKPLTYREVAVASVLAKDHSIEDRLIEQALELYVAFCAYAPGKEKWKQEGNYYTPEELAKMDKIDDFTLERHTNPVIKAD